MHCRQKSVSSLIQAGVCCKSMLFGCLTIQQVWGQFGTLFCKCLSGRKAVKNKHGLITDPELERQNDPSPYQRYPCVCVCVCLLMHMFVSVCGDTVCLQGLRSVLLWYKESNSAYRWKGTLYIFSFMQLIKYIPCSLGVCLLQSEAAWIHPIPHAGYR